MIHKIIYFFLSLADIIMNDEIIRNAVNKNDFNENISIIGPMPPCAAIMIGDNNDSIIVANTTISGTNIEHTKTNAPATPSTNPQNIPPIIF